MTTTLQAGKTYKIVDRNHWYCGKTVTVDRITVWQNGITTAYAMFKTERGTTIEFALAPKDMVPTTH